MKNCLTFSIFDEFEEIDCRFYGRNQAEIIGNNTFHDKLIKMEQVHGDKVTFIDSYFHKKIADGIDGMITDRKNIYLSVKVADCVPIFIYDPDKKIIGIIHSGWKGTQDNIVGKAVELMTRKGSDAKNIKCVIGPAICEKCYMVPEDRFLTFQKKYPDVVQRKNRLALKNIVRRQLIESVVEAENIQVSSYCTRCDNKKFYSFRGGEGDKRNVGIIGLK